MYCDQSVTVQLFLDCVDRTTASSTAFVSFREPPMHFDGNQTLSLRVVEPIADEGVGRLLTTGVTVAVMVKSGDKR